MMGRNNQLDWHVWVEARLSDYIDDQLPLAERSQLEQHATDCAQCRASLESLRWTIALVKHAPAPALKRSFVLPMPVKREPTFTFGFARLATALATLLLFAFVGVDLITQLGGSASAPLAAKSGATNQDIALAPTLTVPAVLSAPSDAQPTAVPATTSVPPAPAALPPAQVTLPRASAAEALATQPALDNAPKGQNATPSVRQPLAGGTVVTATIPLPSPTLAPSLTAIPIPTVVSPPTTIAQAQPEPTRAPVAQPVAVAEPIVTPLRAAEIGLLFLAIFFGALMIGLRRR